ncbi:MAG: hypothetical protein II938_02855 [Alphaproteobacteria bacterium]|nr:hypothetical protein [Alphaproteobacteria bacterium]
MKQFLLVSTLLLTSASAFAFGGNFRTKATRSDFGVTSVGIHYGGKNQADVDFECNGKHEKKDIYGICTCEAGYRKENNVCVEDICETDDECQEGVCVDKTCHSYNYCVETDSNGYCLKWQYCAYESSGNKILGIPNADGGCAATENHRVVCLDTNPSGVCDSWIEPCLKNDEYHEIIGTPMARSFCCDSGHAFCAYTNDKGQCTYWNCCNTTDHTGSTIVGIKNAQGSCNNGF